MKKHGRKIRKEDVRVWKSGFCGRAKVKQPDLNQRESNEKLLKLKITKIPPQSLLFFSFFNLKKHNNNNFLHLS